ncbi:D-alanyl-D-alanine carboxypeptidase [Streptomyces vinaceus]|uniref:D-alanyl-D-alanine carboxypeptidase n=1 Tax=Streptomyces vinaceus TaxID=1960 RepID=UPI0035E1269E
MAEADAAQAQDGAATAADADAARKTGRAADADPEAGTEVAGATGAESDEEAPTEPAPKPETEPQPDDARGAGPKEGPQGEPVATTDAGTEAGGATGTESAEEAPTEPAPKPEAEPQPDDARGAGAKGSTRGEAVARDGLEADATRDATVAGADADADAVRKAGRAKGASVAVADAEAAADAGTEIGGVGGAGSDEDAPAEPAAKAGAGPEAAPEPEAAGAEGDGLASGAKATGGAVSDPAAAAVGEEASEVKKAATGGNAPASGAAAKTQAKGTGRNVSGPATAATDGDAAESDAAVGGTDARDPEVEGADVPGRAPRAEAGGAAARERGADGGGGGAQAEAEGADVSEREVDGGVPQAEAGGAEAPEREVGSAGASQAEGDGGGVRGGRGAGVAEQQGGESAEAAGPGDGAGRVPSWARDDESDAERTSQFVALKDLDAPAEKAPWPRAAAPNRTPGRPPAPTATPTPTPGRPPAPTATPATAPAPAPKPSSPAGLAPGRGAGPARTPSAPAPAAAPAAAPAGPAPVVEPTREVPVPPRPPLDLLAELTNNPPPPETPRRTTVRRVKIWTPILLLLAGAAIGGQLLRPLPAPRIVAAEQTHTLDGQFSVPWPAKGQGAVRVPGSGDIGAFGEQKPVPTASVAKVMTAYVILKNHPLRKTEAGPQIEIDAKTVADGTSAHESRVEGLVAGTKFSQQDMLKMLMIPSGNNVARLLARWDTGTDSEAAFVEKMNAAARELGMKNTTYTDPSGLDAATVSTAADQLKLAEAVMKDEAFRAVVALPSAEIKGLSTPLINNNTLLSVNGLSVRGIKTGSSTPAGGALMWAAYKSVGDETPLIVGTLMDQHADGPDLNGENSLKLVLANSKKIIESVRQALDAAPAVRKGQTVGHVDDGLGGRTPLVATKDLNVIGVPGQQLQLTLRPGAAGTPHSAKAGTEVGVLTVGTGEGAKTVPVALGTSLTEPSFTTRVTRLR